MARSRFIAWGVGLAAAWALLTAPGALASFHLMMVREVYPGSTAMPNAEYVELQMFQSGQNFVETHSVTVYAPNGDLTSTSTFSDPVPKGADQSTILLATPDAQTQFQVVPDLALNSPGALLSEGGAVCWADVDCVSWGNFTGNDKLPSPAGMPAVPTGIPDGMALQRSIARSCATALDGADDQDNSSADLVAVAPAPRPNSVTPTEQRCLVGVSPGGGSTEPPETILRRKPPKRTTDRTPTFRFTSNQPGTRFQCKVDRKPFRDCRSPYTTRRLALGRHVFRVRAVNAAGMVDETAAAYRFKVIARHR